MIRCYCRTIFRFALQNNDILHYLEIQGESGSHTILLCKAKRQTQASNILEIAAA